MKGHTFRVIDGIPILLRDDIRHTHQIALASLSARTPPEVELDVDGIDTYVQNIIGGTNSNLYSGLVGRLTEYPIPEIPIEPSVPGELLLDVGSNWGRWCIAAARKGFHPVGIDPSLEALLAARRIAYQFGHNADFVVGDSRYLPFRPDLFDQVFSFSVFQHFAKEDVLHTLSELRRILKAGGRSTIHMLNSFGLRSAQVQLARGFREAQGFGIRYWTPTEIIRVFTEQIGPTELEMDGFFTQGRESDMPLFSPTGRFLVRLSKALKRMPFLLNVCDNLFVCSRKIT